MNQEVEVARRISAPNGLTVEKVKLSFINRLFPQFGKDREVLLICYVSPEETAKKSSPKKENEEGNTEILEVTGSPLEHSFGDDSFNVSAASLKRNWMNYEERYTPISLKMAVEMINCTREELCKNDLWMTPLLAIADPEKNDEQCIFVGCYPDPRGFMPLKACLGGTMSLSEIQETIQMEVPLVQHNTNATNLKRRKNAQVKVISVYEICGVDPEMVDWREEEKEEFGGYLRIEANWDELSFSPALRNSSNKLFASIVSGSKGSALSPLWDQLLLLDKYIEMLDEYQRKHMSSRYSVAPLNFPKDFSNAFAESTPDIMNKLHRVLTGDDTFDDLEPTDDSAPGGESTSEDDYQIKLSDMARVLEKRQDQDLTSILWRIVKGAESYTAMTDCIHTVFEAIVMDNFKPSLTVGDETRFAKLVGCLDSSKKELPQLAGSVSMELVVDMGLEKLTRDYVYLLSTGNLMENYDVRKMIKGVVEGAFDISKYREKLMSLARIHTSLEFLQLIQNQLNCRMDVSRSIFETALKVYRTTNSPLKFQELRNHVIYSLEATAPKDIVSEVMKTSPTSWMSTLTTDTLHESYTSITHYSRTPIFPPNIYSKQEDMQKIETETEGPIYHVTTGCIIHFKLS